MANILLTGIATLDIINHVAHFPSENEELRVFNQEIRRGGNAANTAEVLSQLDHNVTLICSLAKDSSAEFIHQDMVNNKIILMAEITENSSATPTSYIILNDSNGSRTIVHHRDLDELSFAHFNTIELEEFDWFHFEGRNIEQTRQMMQKAKQYNQIISLEVEKIRNDGDINCLLPLANTIMFSKPFALSQNFISAEQCLGFFSRQYSDKIMSCTWGDQGAWLYKDGQIYNSPAYPPSNIIDTIGAGDTFNAGLIDSLVNKQAIEKSLQNACKLAGLKCGQPGFSQLVKP